MTFEELSVNQFFLAYGVLYQKKENNKGYQVFTGRNVNILPETKIDYNSFYYDEAIKEAQKYKPYVFK